MTIIRKTVPIEVKERRENGGQIIISTGDLDRDKDRVMPSGAQVDNYLRNPVVQYGHDYRSAWATIGKTTSLKIDKDGIVADFDLRPAANEQDPQNIVLLLWSGGWIRTASIGFIPGETVENEEGGKDFNVWELLEWSLVPVPSNANAQRLAVKALDAEPDEPDSETLPDPVTTTDPAVKVEFVEETKRGRALSAANEGKLRKARDLLTDVIAQVEDVDGGDDDKSADIDPALADLIVEALSEAFLRVTMDPVDKTVVPYSAHGNVPKAPKDRPWNGGAARRRLREWAGGEDWSPTKYRKGFVYVRGEPDLLGSYVGPHHDIINGRFMVVWRGVASAMGTLVFGARGGRISDERDRRRVYGHLSSEYRRFDEEPPEWRDYEEDELKELFPELYPDDGLDGHHRDYSQDDEPTNDEPAKGTDDADDEHGLDAGELATLDEFMTAFGDLLNLN